MSDDLPTWLRPDSPIMRLHRRNQKMRRAGFLGIGVGAMARMRRPSMGDRMDNAAEKKWWKAMTEGERHMHKVESAEYERAARVGKHRAGQGKPYRGSKDEAENRKRGKKLG